MEALPTLPEGALIVALIQQLYRIERDAVDVTADHRRAVRQERSLPLLARIDEVRQTLMRTVLPKSPLGDARRHPTISGAC